MQIFVTEVKGETLTIETAANTVDEVKQKIEEKQVVPVPLQRLIFEGKVLEDGRELAYYNVREGSTLHFSMNWEVGMSAREHKRLAYWHLLYKKICRKCYGQLPPKATRCRKAKCGRTTDIRNKKPLYQSQSFFSQEAGPHFKLKTYK